jgi:hypothetical protein
MLGALLGALQIKYPLDVLDTKLREDENEDSHWASDTNRFEDWLLHSAYESASENNTDVFY